MSWSGRHYDSHSDDQINNHTIIAKTQNNTFYTHGSSSDSRYSTQHAYVAADNILAIPKSTTSIYRSASTGACPQRGAVKVIYPSNSRIRSLSRNRTTVVYRKKSRSRSRSRSFERGRSLYTTPAISIDSISNSRYSTQRTYVPANNTLSIPKSTTSIYRSASTGACSQRGAVKVIYPSNSRIRSLSRNRTTVVYRKKSPSRSRSRNRTTVVYRKKSPSRSRSRNRTTVVYRKKSRNRSRSRSRTTVVYRKKSPSRSRSRNRTTVVYRK